MASSRKTQKPDTSGASSAIGHKISGPFMRGAAGVSSFTLGISVAAMAWAQSENIYEKESGSRFKAAPKAPDAEADAAVAASTGPDMILGIDVNTIFFVTAGVIALFWFTLGGGRKPKVSRDS